ncbi:MAG: RNA polymerase sigma factor [Pseudomonadota bacterium]
MQHELIRWDSEFDRRWRPALMAFFLRRISDRSEAEDLTQEVFVRMLKQDNHENVRDAYVFQIASNLIIDRARRVKVRADHRMAAIIANDTAIDHRDPLRIASSKDELDVVVSVLNSIATRQRQIFLLYRIDGRSQAEIADELGVSVSAVKKNVAKTLALIAAALEDPLA